jgi:hypothetical protein
MFWRIGLGLRVDTTPLTIPNAVSSASRSHKTLIRDFLIQSPGCYFFKNDLAYAQPS